MNYSKNICEHISKLMVVREEIWACVISICNSKCTLTTAELIKARSLIEQLETTYQYEPLNQQSCKVIHVVWETLDSQLKECVLQTWGGSIMETSGTTLLDSSSTRLSWNEVDATPPQGHIVTCVSSAALTDRSPWSISTNGDSAIV